MKGAIMEQVKEKLFQKEQKAKEWILEKKRLRVLFLAIVILLAIMGRICVLDFQSRDYQQFLKPWMDQINELGKINSLKYNIGDYNVPYVVILTLFSYLPISPLILIKLLSIVFDFIGAIYVSKLVYEWTKEKEGGRLVADILFAIILFLPTVFINSSVWGQCDMIYVTFLIMSLYYLKKDCIVLAFSLLGVAFAFKLQFIFILPIYVLLYFKRKDISVLHFLIIPIVNLMMCLPAILMGKSIVDCILVYFKQTGTYTSLVMNYPNLYNVFGEFFGNQSMVLVIFTVVIVGILVFYILSKKIDIQKDMIPYALMFALIMVYFLPRMHERYGFLAEILSVVYVGIYKKHYAIPIVLQLATLAGYWEYFVGGHHEFFLFMSLVEFVVIVKFTIDTLGEKKINYLK